MSEFNPSSSTTTNMKGQVPNFQVSSKVPDSPTDQFYWDSPEYPIYYGYYDEIGQLKTAVNDLIIWTIGKGWETSSLTQVQLEKITGNGKETFLSILFNLLVNKFINGDSFAEIVRNDKGTLINLKSLTPNRVRIVFDDKGMIDRYEYLTADRKGVMRKFKPVDIFHLINDRVGDSISGTSILKASKKIIDTMNEAMADIRRVMHRSTIRVMYVDFDDQSKINTVKSQYAEAIKNGELLILPAKKGDVEFEELTVPPVQIYLEMIRYYENYLYVVVNVPQAIVSPQGFSEASSKVGFMTFEPRYSIEAAQLEAQLWNQLAIKLTFNRPPSLLNQMQESESKNTGQVGFQDNEFTASATRTE